MTIDELWQNLKPLVGKVEKLEPIVEKLVEKVDKLEITVCQMKEDMRKMQQINMTSLIKGQIEIKQELKNVEKRLTEKIESYRQENEVEHKKFEYKIANLEWKSKTIS